jgi:uncharacterized phage infection (PIP) family protein YhgE
LSSAALAEEGYTKDETVYVNLDSSGSPEGVYVVNSFETRESQAVTDFGDYSSVKYLSRSGSPSFTNDTVSLDLPEGRLYYQGNMSETKLPWTFKLNYILNGKTVSAEDLAGASGSLEIQIDISEGEAGLRDFYDNYLVQVSYSLDSNKCSNVKSEKANIVSAGNSINVSYTHMQGRSATYSLSCDIKDFEMGAISIRALSRSLPEISTEPIDELTAQVTELSEGVSKLSEAAAMISEASASFSEGLTSFHVKSEEIAAASSQLNSAITSLNTACGELIAKSYEAEDLAKQLSRSEDKQVQMLAKAYLVQTQAVVQLADGIAKLSESYAAFNKGLSSLPQQVFNMKEGYAKIDKGFSELSSNLAVLDDEVADMPLMLDEKVDSLLSDYLGSDFKPISFASPKARADSVTFIMKTPEISLPEEAPPVIEVKEPVTFWEKLLDLFGLFK